MSDRLGTKVIEITEIFLFGEKVEYTFEKYSKLYRLIDKILTNKGERAGRFHDLEWHPNAKDVLLGAHKKKGRSGKKSINPSNKPRAECRFELPTILSFAQN
ncbi:hypothetical protein BpHYR1_020228 [Brachionus plicatilis]|uniref:Uncharacterized protein n=1 Tax=Brachionus plicatilis TaxID=10195 RepID=A0A3M7RIB3_BRAPC|nr:hypothetical protein BpHYR1_020228 [Brachionus plicatilis]